MKYIKLYERYELKYRSGDYVLVSKWNYPYNYVLISKTDNIFPSYFGYWAIEDEGIWFNDWDIKRLLTSEDRNI